MYETVHITYCFIIKYTCILSTSMTYSRAVQMSQGQGRQSRLFRGGCARDTTRAGDVEARLGLQRSVGIMPPFSPEERHAIMAAVDALLLQVGARVPLYQTAAG